VLIIYNTSIISAPFFSSTLKSFKNLSIKVIPVELDFIFLDNFKAVPVEVKYKEKIYDREFKNLEIFSRKFKLKKALCLWKNINVEKIKLGELVIEKKPVYFI